MKHPTMFDLALDALTYDQLDKKITSYLTSKRLHHIVTLNPEMLLYACNHKSYQSILKTASLKIIDGAGIIIMGKCIGLPLRWSHRHTGVAVSHNLLRRAAHDKSSILLVVRSDGLSQMAEVEKMTKKRYPKAILHVVSEKVHIQDLALLNPTVALVGLGIPHQDEWIHKIAHRIPSLKIAIGIGGTFDFLSGKIKRAPVMLQKLGLEWLWRLLQLPFYSHRMKRIKRILNAVIIFPWIIITKSCQK